MKFLKDLHAKCQVRYICTLIKFNVTQIATTCMNALMLFHLSKCNGGWTEKWEYYLSGKCRDRNCLSPIHQYAVLQ
jgi:hypothetical protein